MNSLSRRMALGTVASVAVTAVKTLLPADYDFIMDEKRRNWDNRETYGRLMRRGLGCKDGTVVFSHHLIFDPGDGRAPQEIPAADTLIFNPTIMSNAFGGAARQISMHLATLSPAERDMHLKKYLDDIERIEQGFGILES